MLKRTRKILQDTVENYVASNSLTRGAAIAFYSVTSLIPVLVIVIAIAGLAFGEEAARGAIVRELSELVGPDGAMLVQGAIESAYNSDLNWCCARRRIRNSRVHCVGRFRRAAIGAQRHLEDR